MIKYEYKKVKGCEQKKFIENEHTMFETDVLQKQKKLLPIQRVVGSTLTKVEKRELLDNEFYCSKCDTIHTKTAYAVAQRAMNVDLIFTCTCGNKIDL
jgi:hypothetical protein